jgi:hypothetical protein
MKSWSPVLFSILAIFISILIIKSNFNGLAVPTQSISTPTNPVTTLTPSPAPTPTIIVINDYLKTYAKCGEIPLLPDYSFTRFPGEYSIRTWSPTCRFIVWSATIKYSFGKWTASPYEGLFLYDIKTQKTSRLYTPQSESDIVVFKNWRSDTTFIFHKDFDSSDYLYDLSTQSINKN